MKHEFEITGSMGRKQTVTGYRVAEHFGVHKVPGVQCWVVTHLASGCQISDAAAGKLTDARANAEKLAALPDFKWDQERPFPDGASGLRQIVQEALK